MNYRNLHIVLAGILLLCSVYLVIGGGLVDRMDFVVIGFIGAFGCGECIRRVIFEGEEEW